MAMALAMKPELALATAHAPVIHPPLQPTGIPTPRKVYWTEWRISVQIGQTTIRFPRRRRPRRRRPRRRRPLRLCARRRCCTPTSRTSRRAYTRRPWSTRSRRALLTSEGQAPSHGGSAYRRGRHRDPPKPLPPNLTCTLLVATYYLLTPRRATHRAHALDLTLTLTLTLILTPSLDVSAGRAR